MTNRKYDHVGFRPTNKVKEILLKTKNKSGYINLAIEYIEFIYNLLNNEERFDLVSDFTKYELEQLKNMEERMNKCIN